MFFYSSAQKGYFFTIQSSIFPERTANTGNDIFPERHIKGAIMLKRAAVIGIALVTSLFAGTYNVDTSHSNIGFKVKHMMVSNVRGSFDDFKGNFDYDEKNKTLQKLNGEIAVISINTANKKRDDHLRSDEIFSAKKYPTITFTLDKISGNTALGTMKMKGVTKKVELVYEFGGTITDHYGNERMGFSLNGTIKRSDYGITWNKILEAGGVAVGDEVKLEIEIEGIKKSE